MLKHIVEVNATRDNTVLVEYTVTDGTRAAHAQVEVSMHVPPFTIVRETRTGRLIARIVDQGYYMDICEDLKRQATDHFHGEVTTEIRMNER